MKQYYTITKHRSKPVTCNCSNIRKLSLSASHTIGTKIYIIVSISEEMKEHYNGNVDDLDTSILHSIIRFRPGRHIINMLSISSICIPVSRLRCSGRFPDATI
jgi:hypothetical protein